MGVVHLSNPVNAGQIHQLTTRGIYLRAKCYIEGASKGQKQKTPINGDTEGRRTPMFPSPLPPLFSALKKRALIPLFRRKKFENKAMRGTFIKARRILDKSRILKRK